MGIPVGWLTGIGIVTAVGDCTAQTASSVRAGISRYKESNIGNKSAKPMTLALCQDKVLPPLHKDLIEKNITARHIRMLRLAHKAVAEATSEHQFTKPIPLLLAGPETYPEQPLAITDTFLNQLIIQSETNFDRGYSRIFPNGRAGGMAALKAGLGILSDGDHDSVLIGGVDSHLDLELLRSLDRDDRILAEGIMDGFCPGEGAGFLLICSESKRRTMNPAPIIQLHDPGLAVEKGHRYSKEPYRGDGLTLAINSAIAAMPNQTVKSVMSSLNGEQFGAKEWSVALTRNSKSFAKDYSFEHPAECFGDLGAATSTVLLGIAATGLTKGYLSNPCLAWCSSDLGPRGAVCLTLSTNT